MKAIVIRLLITCIALSSASTQKEYEEWFGSSYRGLGMSATDAAAWASSESVKLTACGITLHTLQCLRDVLYLAPSDGFGLSLPEVQKWIFPLAYAHSSPRKLISLYKVLSYAIPSGGMDLARSEAQSRAIELSLRQTEPEVLRALWAGFYGLYGSEKPERDLATKTAIEQATAGADPDKFIEAYLSAKRKRFLPQASCIVEASREAVQAALQGLVRRYAKDAIPYTAAEFQSHYGDAWFNEWVSSPMEQHVAQDGLQYTAASFAEYYGSSWVAHWSSSKVATQVRIAQDGKLYTMKEFAEYYKDEWRNLWFKAPETRCQECGPYPGQTHLNVVV